MNRLGLSLKSARVLKRVSIRPSIGTERGAALLEFAILLPLLILVSIVSLELIRTTGALKVAVQMSREAANIVFRDCIGVGEPTNPADLQLLMTCVNERRSITTSFNSAWGRDGVEVLVSYYEVVQTDTGVQLEYWGTSSSGAVPSQFDASRLIPEIQNLLGERIVVAEAYIPHRSILPGIAGMFHYDAGFVYDVTVL